MPEVLFWVYLVNSVFLINHEIDSAYWKEWVVVHFPLLFLLLYGLVLVFQRTPAGLIFSLVLSLGGIFAFTIHIYFIKRGRHEFNAPISLFILIATLMMSLAQGAITIYMLTN
jgi:hypothetical protein